MAALPTSGLSTPILDKLSEKQATENQKALHSVQSLVLKLHV